MKTLILTFLFTISAAAQASLPGAEEYMEAHWKNGVIQGNVLVARNGQTLFERSYGIAAPERPHDPGTKFRIASVTKPLTAVAVLRQVERGAMGLDDPISRYVETPDAWKNITVRQLLTHSSGIHNYTDLPRYSQRTPQPKTLWEVLSAVRDLPLKFEPGTNSKYSNSGFTLLGLALERVTGKPYYETIRRDVLEPAGMRNSGYSGDPAAKLADGFVGAPPDVRLVKPLDAVWPNAAGALYSTARDLVLFHAALQSGKLLLPETVAAMEEPAGGTFGLGWFVETRNGRRHIWHGGDLDGLTTMLSRYPDEDVVVVALANLESVVTREIARGLGDLALGEKVEIPRSTTNVTVAPQQLDKLVGEYRIINGGPLRFERNGETLVVITGRGEPAPLAAETPTRFTLALMRATVDFETDASGMATGATITAPEGRMQAVRVR